MAELAKLQKISDYDLKEIKLRIKVITELLTGQGNEEVWQGVQREMKVFYEALVEKLMMINFGVKIPKEFLIVKSSLDVALSNISVSNSIHLSLNEFYSYLENVLEKTLGMHQSKLNIGQIWLFTYNIRNIMKLPFTAAYQKKDGSWSSITDRQFTYAVEDRILELENALILSVDQQNLPAIPSLLSKVKFRFIFNSFIPQSEIILFLRYIIDPQEVDYLVQLKKQIKLSKKEPFNLHISFKSINGVIQKEGAEWTGEKFSHYALEKLCLWLSIKEDLSQDSILKSALRK